jgi:hypothetical protein
MIILDATNKSLTALMDTAAATTNPDVSVSYADITTTTFVPSASDTVLNGTNVVTIVASPASSTQRQVKLVNIFNVDTIAHKITIRYLDNATNRVILSWTLNPGDSLTYTTNSGWVMSDSTGAKKIGTTSLAGDKLLKPIKDAANTSTTLSLTSATSYAIYAGVCPVASSSINVTYNVTTACATITYAEIAIFKGSVNLNGNPTLTRLGFADISGVANTTGIKNTTISLSTAAVIGDVLWIVLGDQATTTMIIRAGLADDIQTGIFATISGRPSTITSPTAWTLAGNTIAVPWVSAFVN